MATSEADSTPVVTKVADQFKAKKILEQVEYYFGDINLPRDKFLQEEMKQDQGWIPLRSMLKCNRLAGLSTDEAVIAGALKDSRLVEVSEDGTKIRRSPNAPSPPENTKEYWQEVKRRTIFMKGIPQDATLDEIADFVRQLGGDIKCVTMRRTVGKGTPPRMFKGSVYVTYAHEEQAKRVAALSGLKFRGEHELVNQMQEEYWANKLAERALKKQLRPQANEDEKKRKAGFMKGLVLKISGLPPKGESEMDIIKELKQFLKSYAKASYVIIGETEATVRFHGTEEGTAAKAWQRAVEATAEGKVLLNERELGGRVLEGEEETAYWTEFKKAREAKRKKAAELKSAKKGPNSGWRRRRRRAADQGLGHEARGCKRAKRTVFKDEDEDDEEEGEEKNVEPASEQISAE